MGETPVLKPREVATLLLALGFVEAEAEIRVDREEQRLFAARLDRHEAHIVGRVIG